MKTKTVQLIVAFLMCATWGFSQKCKVTKDEFSGETVASFDFKDRMVYFECKGATVRLELTFDYSGELNVMVPLGSDLLFKLENGSKINKKTTVDASPKTKVVASAFIQTDYTYIVELSKEEVEKMATAKVTMCRYPDTKGGYLDIPIKGKWQGALFDGAVCMQGNIK